MTISIKGIDKIKLFLKLYNYIQSTPFGNKEAILKDHMAAHQLLAKNNFDYGCFELYCDLKNDEVDPTTFNAIYGEGSPVFEKMVKEVEKEIQSDREKIVGLLEAEELKAKAELSSKPGSSVATGSKPGSSKPASSEAGLLDYSGLGLLPPSASTSLYNIFQLSLRLEALHSPGSSPSTKPGSGSVAAGGVAGAGATVGVGATASGSASAASVVGARSSATSSASGTGLGIDAAKKTEAAQNWDRFGKLKDNQTVYFTQLANSGTNYWNPREGSCGYISLGTTRESVLKILSETKNKYVHELIAEAMESELSNSSLSIQSSCYSLFRRLKFFQNAVSVAEETACKLQADLKRKYWDYTKFARNTSTPILDSTKWSITLDEFRDILKKLILTKDHGLDGGELARDFLKLNGALDDAKDKASFFKMALREPGAIETYLEKSIKEDWMSANIALAWAIVMKRTVRIWKHKEVATKSEEVYLLRDSTDEITKTTPHFHDSDPIDILLTPMIGVVENHYERLVKVNSPTHGARPKSTPPVTFSKALEAQVSDLEHLIQAVLLSEFNSRVESKRKS